MTTNSAAIEFAVEAARIAADSKAENVRVLDLRGVSGLADFFVLATGTSDRQMRATLDRISDYAVASGRRAFRAPDVRSTTWILADYVDVVVHVFDREHREYYDLDGLWGDVPRVNWERPAPQSA